MGEAASDAALAAAAAAAEEAGMIGVRANAATSAQRANEQWSADAHRGVSESARKKPLGLFFEVTHT